MSSIDVPDSLKEKLIQAALRRGYVVRRGQHSQLADFLAYLLSLDASIGESPKRRSKLSDALGMLAVEGAETPSDEAIDRILDERRMRH